MEGHLVYEKTLSGDEATRNRTRLVQRNLRMVLVLVDGVSTVAELISKAGNSQLVFNAIKELEAAGYVALSKERSAIAATDTRRTSRIKTEEKPLFSHFSEFSTFGASAMSTKSRVAAHHNGIAPEKIAQIDKSVLASAQPKTPVNNKAVVLDGKNSRKSVVQPETQPQSASTKTEVLHGKPVSTTHRSPSEPQSVVKKLNSLVKMDRADLSTKLDSMPDDEAIGLDEQIKPLLNERTGRSSFSAQTTNNNDIILENSGADETQEPKISAEALALAINTSTDDVETPVSVKANPEKPITRPDDSMEPKDKKDTYKRKIATTKTGRSGWKTVLVALFVLVIVLIAGVIFYPYNNLIPNVEATLNQMLGHKVAITDLDVSLYPEPVVKMSQVAIGNNKDNSLVIDEITLKPNLQVIFGRKLFSQVEVNGMSLNNKKTRYVARYRKDAFFAKR